MGISWCRNLSVTAVATIGFALALNNVANAQQEAPDAYPSRNILLVVPFPPGGPPDIISRVIAQPLGEILGKPVIVENRPGASTALAARSVARAAPDGYTLLAVDMSQTVAQHILSAPGFDPVKDFRPIAPTAQTVLTMVLNPSVQIKTLEELVALTKSKPDQIIFAHSGIGTPPHLGIVAFTQSSGASIALVPYRGAAMAISDVVAGHAHGLITAPSTAIQLAREGKVHMIAVTGRQRLSSLPEIPTFSEGGVELKVFDDGVWTGMVAPAATPDAIIAKLENALNAAIRDPGVIERLGRLDVTMTGGTGESLRSRIADQVKFWGETLKAAGVKPE